MNVNGSKRMYMKVYEAMRWYRYLNDGVLPFTLLYYHILYYTIRLVHKHSYAFICIHMPS